MAREIRTDKEVFQFQIEGRMTLAFAEELREAISPIVARFQEIEIDLSQVLEVDFAGLLLMVEMKLGAMAWGKKLYFTGHSRPVTEIMGLCDLSGFLGERSWAGRPQAERDRGL